MKVPALLVAAATATGVLAAPAAPEVTPRAILPRAVANLGFYSFSVSNGYTVYNDWKYDPSSFTYTTVGHNFRRCTATSSCAMFTGCSSGYLMVPGTSTYCGVGGGSSAYFCSSHILYTSSGASDPYTWYWCDQSTLTGITFYATLPENAYTGQTDDAATTNPGPSSTDSGPSSTDSSNSRATDASTRATASVPTSSPTTSDASGAPAENKKSTPTGAIAGGVVGGIAILAALGVGIFFLMRRNKNKTPSAAAGAGAPAGVGAASTQPPVAQQWNPTPVSSPPPPGYAVPAGVGIQEQKPEQGYYGGYAQQGQPGYDPRVSQYTNVTGPPGSPGQPQGPVEAPGYTGVTPQQAYIGELPASSPGPK